MSVILPMPNHKLIGHRGAAGLRPENTFCSFKHAAQLGLNWIEFDVRLTKDDQWIVMHDDSLDRTTNGHGLVKDHTLATLQKLEAGRWFKPPYTQEKIPTLLETLELANTLNICCNIEIKDAELDLHKYATLFTSFINANQHLINRHAILVSSFSLPCLLQLRSTLPNLPLGYLIEKFAADTIEIALQNNFASINCDVNQTKPTDIKEAINANIPILIYTINDSATANLWLNQGISGIFTDRPDLLL